MIKQKQLFRHRPSEGEIGDCHRTALACLLDLHPSEVPHFGEMTWDVERGKFEEGSRFHDLVGEFLASKGLAAVDVVYDAPLDCVLRAQAHINPRAYYLLGGQSATGVNHTVICRGGEIHWDPGQDDPGIVAPCQPDGLYWVTYLVPLAFMSEAA